MALKIRCKDERGEVKNGCGVRVVLWIREGTQSMRAGVGVVLKATKVVRL